MSLCLSILPNSLCKKALCENVDTSSVNEETSFSAFVKDKIAGDCGSLGDTLWGNDPS
jgi:hypothetical protein